MIVAMITAAAGVRPTRARGSGFTLLELLVVVGVVAALSAVLIGGFAGSGSSVSLRAGQATLSGMIATARTVAMAGGMRARLLINADTAAGERFRRQLVLQVETAPGEWTVRESVLLPAGVYVVPYRTRVPAGIFANENDWKANGSTELISSGAIWSSPVQAEVEGVLASWDYVQFVAAGTVATNGSIVLATGRARPPAAVAAGESPIEFTNPRAVRGVSLSVYGLVRQVDDWSEL